MIKLTDEEKDTLSYNDVAYLILKDTNKKIKIQDLFKEVIKAMDLPESTFEDDIEEFFELIITDKRLTMIDNGFVDLKINHSTKMIVDEDEDEDQRHAGIAGQDHVQAHQDPQQENQRLLLCSIHACMLLRHSFRRCIQRTKP